MDRASLRFGARERQGYGEVAKRSNAADCKSVALAASKVRILPSPPAFARFASFGQAGQRDGATLRSGRRRAANATRNTVTRREGAAERNERRSASGAQPLGGVQGSPPSKNEGGSNSVVESQPSKLLVAGSIPVSRSNLCRAFAALTAAVGRPEDALRVGRLIGPSCRRSARVRGQADLSAEAPGGRHRRAPQRARRRE